MYRTFQPKLPTGALLILFSFAATCTAAEHTKDTLEVVKANVGQGKALIVDVREKAEWDESHLEGALFVPLSKLQRAADPESLEDEIDKSKILYTHCKAGKRALLAADILEKLGYKVRPLKQGTADLIKAGFPESQEQ